VSNSRRIGTDIVPAAADADRTTIRVGVTKAPPPGASAVPDRVARRGVA
jgi:hypothetical protein